MIKNSFSTKLQQIKFRLLIPIVTLVVIIIVILSLMLLAPQSSPREQVLGDNYYSYSPQALNEAKTESAAVLLNFYATWCGSCNEFEPTIKGVLEEVGPNNNIRAFRINFGDSAETPEGKDLARKYGVTIQSTTIILSKSGKVFKTYFTPVPAAELKSALLAATLA